jgi:glycosyltransferase involved in cell wall biosynthesis
MKLLNVVVSHNFAYYLRNTVESLLDFFPPGDILIIDNASTSAYISEVFAELKNKSKRITVIKRSTNDPGKKTGSLYEANNFAIQYGLENKYDMFQFIQDDMQFMYYQQGAAEKIYDLLSLNPKVSMIMPLFQKKIMEMTLSERYKRRDDLGTWESNDYGVADIGFMLADFVRTNSFNFGPSETSHSQYWLGKGFRIHALQEPFLAYLPWVAIRRGKHHIGKERKPIKKFYYKPLDNLQIRALSVKSKDTMVCTEDFCLLWGYLCLYPYWFTMYSTEYLKYVFKHKLGFKFLGVDLEGTRFSTVVRGRFSPDWLQLTLLFIPSAVQKFISKIMA